MPNVIRVVGVVIGVVISLAVVYSLFGIDGAIFFSAILSLVGVLIIPIAIFYKPVLLHHKPSGGKGSNPVIPDGNEMLKRYIEEHQDKSGFSDGPVLWRLDPPGSEVISYPYRRTPRPMKKAWNDINVSMLPPENKDAIIRYVTALTDCGYEVDIDYVNKKLSWGDPPSVIDFDKIK